MKETCRTTKLKSTYVRAKSARSTTGVAISSATPTRGAFNAYRTSKPEISKSQNSSSAVTIAVRIKLVASKSQYFKLNQQAGSEVWV